MVPIPFCLGYAETHYRFLPGLSPIYRKQPEILTDAPARIEPGQDLPLALIIKDAHLFPVVLEKVEIAVHREGAGCIWRQVVFEGTQTIADPLFWRVFTIPTANLGGATIAVNSRIEFQSRGRSEIALNDNFPALPHSQMVVHIADQSLPCEPGWLYGDAHVHTNYSSSHVEFGAPLALTSQMAKAFGLSWFAAADHSYDFMCVQENYRRFDASAALWNKRATEINGTSREVTVLPSEEISCANAKGRNVHVLAIGNRDFVAGSGDGARRKRNRKPEHTIQEAISLVRGQGGLCFAAHPLVQAGWLQNLALNRGAWSGKDLAEDLNGLQFWSGHRDISFFRMRKKWVDMLLAGRRLPLVAGTDAHGDFNCTRKIKTPFFSLEQNPVFFGMARTCVQASSSSEKDIMAALAQGQSIVTDGPFCRIRAEEGRICWRALSTPEFGRLWQLRISAGRFGESEQIIGEQQWKDGRLCYDASGEVSMPTASYIRAELIARLGGHELLCMTNPIYC